MTETVLPHSEKDRDSAIGVDTSGRMNYASGAESGHTEISLPSLPGSPNSEERLLMKDFGVHVSEQIERSFRKQPYMQSGPQQSPPATFRHYVSVAKGAKLVDSGTLSRMEILAKEFEGEAERQEYFQQVIRPYLFNLTPRRRT
jgi:hypothetical protein